MQNVGKKQVTIFSRRKTPVPNTLVELRSQPMANAGKTKSLCVTVDETLNWKGHVSFVAEILSKSCGILYEIQNCLTILSKSKIVLQPYASFSDLLNQRKCFYTQKKSCALQCLHKC